MEPTVPRHLSHVVMRRNMCSHGDPPQVAVFERADRRRDAAPRFFISETCISGSKRNKELEESTNAKGAYVDLDV